VHFHIERFVREAGCRAFTQNIRAVQAIMVASNFNIPAFHAEIVTEQQRLNDSGWSQASLI
jgi:hypothetical protein